MQGLRSAVKWLKSRRQSGTGMVSCCAERGSPGRCRETMASSTRRRRGRRCAASWPRASGACAYGWPMPGGLGSEHVTCYAKDGGRYSGWARVKGGTPWTIAGFLDRAWAVHFSGSEPGALSLQLRRKIFVVGASRSLNRGQEAVKEGVGGRMLASTPGGRRTRRASCMSRQAAHFDIPEQLALERGEGWQVGLADSLELGQEEWQRKINQQVGSARGRACSEYSNCHRKGDTVHSQGA